MNKSKLKDLIEATIAQKGTDLHICPAATPHIRINGILTSLDMPLLDNIAVKSIIDEALTVEQKRSLNETKVAAFSFSINGIGRFRACAYSQRGTFAITIHILPIGVPSIVELGFSENDFANYTSKNKGLILATGGVGTGKTTTLAAMVSFINETKCCHIATIEEPIEYLHRHNKSIVTQKEIGADIPDIKTALAWVAKSDPDVVMINELPRHKENLRLAVSIAEEKLLLAGLTTTEPKNAIVRLTKELSQEQGLLDVLEGVVFQTCDETVRKYSLFGRKEVIECRNQSDLPTNN